MLAHANRVTHGADYKATVRRGVRVSSPHLVSYCRRRPGQDAVRFGFIVGKQVGIATRRNRIRRRLKAACRQVMGTVDPGTDIVIRALPASAHAGWTTLLEEVTRAVDKVSTR